MKITSADGGILRSGAGLVVVPWNPLAEEPEQDPGALENEHGELKKFYLVLDEPARAQAEDIRKARRRPTQEVDDELAACFPQTGPIYEYVHWAAKLTHTPPAFHLAAILPVVAFEACRRNYYVEQTPLHVWTAMIAPPAVGKTTAVGYAQDFSKDFYGRIFRGDLRSWVSLEGSLPGVVEALAQMRDDAHDITPGILYHSELSRVLRADDAAELLCLLYDCRDIERNLRYLQKRSDKGDDVKMAVVAPRVSCVVTSTRAAMQSVFKAHMVFGGLASRLTWFYVPQVDPEKLMYKELTDKKGRERAIEAWASWIGVLDSFSAYGAARQVSVSLEAEELFEAFYDECLRPVVADPENEIASIAQRSSGTVLRIAALYAMSVGQLGIDEDCARRAINLMKRSLSQSELLMPQLAESSFGRASAILLDAALAAGTQGLARRDQYKLVRGQPKAFLDQVRDTLIDGGFLVEALTPTTMKGGRPSMRLYAAEHAPGAIRVPATVN